MSTGFTFGAKNTAPPTFGASTFGTPQSQPQQQQQQQQFGFGTPTTTTTPSLFGTATSTNTSLGFKPTGFGFATPATTTTIASQPNTGFTFGTPASSAPATGLAFGTPVSSAPGTGLTFGTPASSAPTTGLAFGTPQAASGLNFGTPAASTGLTFGTPATTTTTATGLGFGAPTFGLTTSAPSTGLGFGLNTSTAPTLNFSGAPTLTIIGTNFGLTTPSFGLTSTTTPQQSLGLGGIPQTKSGTTVTTQKETPPKEQTLPNEILQNVEQFKNLIQEEKNRSSEVARCSVKEFHKVGNELDSLNYQLNQIENQLQTYRKLAEQLKYDTAKSLQNIEIAQRTQDTPPGLQYDNNAPLQFFLELAENFEREMQFLKTKIDNTEKYVKKYGESAALTSQDLAVGLKQLHETFVALAGRMQSIHNQVEAQKENYLSFRKQAYRDFTNPFETTQKLNETVNSIMKNTLINPPKLASGPTPFNNIALGASNLVLTQQQNPNASTGLGK